MSLIFQDIKISRKAVMLTENELLLLDQMFRKQINEVKDPIAKTNLRKLHNRFDKAYQKLSYSKLGRLRVVMRRE